MDKAYFEGGSFNGDKLAKELGELVLNLSTDTSLKNARVIKDRIIGVLETFEENDED